ncbi:MAG TPA: PKD domain-containing protein, partial [Thermoanaerobaculia bacterium]|nr:PKD domain-containing protein [Thermoanaerobaculia bacterium]
MNRFRVYGLTCVLLFVAIAARATTIVLPTDEQLIAKSPVIVAGAVVSTNAVERNGVIWTDTVVEVARTIKGNAADTITIRELGGEIDGRITKVFGTAEFNAGERVLLFLEPNPRGGYRTIDLFVGKFTEARAMDGRRLWLREDGAQDVQFLDGDFREVAPRNIQRDAAGFESFVNDRVAGRAGAKNYGIENPVLERGTGDPRITANFTLISEPTVYRWFRFDSNQSAAWYSAGTQPGYSNGGVAELQTAMAAWTGYSEANIRYTYAGTSTGSMGGLGSPNGTNEVLFNDPLGEISGTWNRSTGGVVGTGGFNGVSSGGNWNAPFAADAQHPAGSIRAYNITEGNLVIQDGVSASTGISSTRLAEIVAHEFGHTLGFGHSTDGTALMYPTVTGLGPSLRADDQLAARWLYPNGSSTTPNPQVPAAPGNLRATVSGTNIDLAWDDNATNETGQSIYLAVGNGSFGKVSDVAANVKSARVSGLTGGSYRVYVVSFNGAGNSNPSNTVTATIASAPVANFTVDPQSGTAGVTSFTFTDQSTGGITARQWNFGDGSTSTASAASHIYATPGQYTITLTVSANGLSAQTTKSVLVFAPLDASFAWTPANPTITDTVQFTDQTTGAPTTWSWTFGDGTTSSEQNPSKKYANAGTYLVRLSVTRSGSSSSTTKTLIVSSGVPVTPNVVAAFGLSAASPAAGAQVTFTDQSSGTPTNWSWTFGDGGTSSAKNPAHTYAAEGTYTVTLTAANATSSSTTSKEITVTEAPAYRSLISVAAVTGGVGGTSWRTELTLFNAGSQGASVKMLFLPAGGGSPITRDVFLAAHQSQTYANALLDLFAIPSGAGAMAVEASSAGTNADLRITSRTFTTGPAGTYGQSVPDVQPASLGKTLYVAGIKSSSAYRTNLGLVNRASSDVAITLTLLSATGGTTSSKNLTLPANSFQQASLATYFPEVEGRTFELLSLKIASTVADVVSGYASVVDNVTQDPVYIQAVSPAIGGALSVPVVGRAPGANGTFWRSDVTFYNPTTSRMVLTLRYGNATRAIAVEGGETEVLPDVLSEFGETAGSAALRVEWTLATGPVVTTRTYTSVENGGTYGQSIDPLAQLGNDAFVPGLRNDTSYRTNVGFVNGGSDTETFAVVALSPSGNELGRTTVTLAAGAQTQSAITALLSRVSGNFTLYIEGDG